MIGLNPEEQRHAFQEDVDVLMHILRGGEQSPTPPLQAGRSQEAVRAVQRSLSDFVVAVIASPSGPLLAGRTASD